MRTKLISTCFSFLTAMLVSFSSLLSAQGSSEPNPDSAAAGKPSASDTLVSQARQPKQVRNGPVYRIPVDGVIEMGIAPFIKRSIKEAEAANARAVVLDINTLGGRVDAALEIVDAIGSSVIPVYALVSPRAISAGALIAISADSVFMTPNAHLGASTVVGGDGEKVSEKAQSVMRAQFRALAESRGLDPRIGEAMVDEDVEVPGISPKGKLLTLTAHEAQKVGYAQEIASFDALLQRIGVPESDVIVAHTNWAEKLTRFLTNPIVSSLLMTIGLLALFAEIKAPGFGVGGAIGILALGLFFGSHMIVGLAGWEEVILMVIGLVLVVVEIFVIPGFGVAGVIGVLAMAAGIFMALLGDYNSNADFIRASSIFGASLIMILVAPFILVRYLPKYTGSRGGVLLSTATRREEGYISAPTRTDLVGKVGIAYTDLRPAGTALINDERVDVVCETGFLLKGTALTVVAAEPYRTIVAPSSNRLETEA